MVIRESNALGFVHCRCKIRELAIAEDLDDCIASRVAHTVESVPLQFLALLGFVFAEALIFVPLLFIAPSKVGGGVIESAAAVTILAFGALTAVVFFTKKDLSFLGSFLRWGGILALVLIVSGILFGFQLGTFFSVAMIGLAGGAILYDTSNITSFIIILKTDTSELHWNGLLPSH